MSYPSEYDFIEKCKQLINERLGWAHSTEWRIGDYKYLSELIYEKTRITISVSTLKRIWQNNKQRTPHISTLNALVLFIEYSSWHDFKSKIRNEINPNGISDFTPKSWTRIRKNTIILYSILSIVLIMYLFFSQKYLIRKKHSVTFNINDIKFDVKKTVESGLPSSVVFYYDIVKADFDSAFIQQDWDINKRKRILKDDHYHTSIYYYPRNYEAKLILNDSIVRTYPLQIKTDGWLALYEKKLFNNIPFYLKNIEVIKNERLFISAEDLEMNEIENDKDYFISFYNSRDFGEIYCDNFSLESEIKNDPKEGGLTCGISGISVLGEKGKLIATFSDPGCISQLQLQFSDFTLNGSRSDLSAFGTDLSVWRNIKYEVINKNVTIYIDDKEVIKFQFRNNIGKITGLGYHFYGCGSVRKSVLYDKEEKVIFDDEFDH